MTAQVQDSFSYFGENHALVAFSNDEPFSPASAGYRPVMASTACYRGYVCGYEVKDDQLRLCELWVNHQPGEAPITQRLQPPDLNGIVGARETAFFGSWHFSNVGLPLTYSGGLLLGRDFIRELYVHLGFHPAWKYQHVHELVFEQGRLVEARDASQDMARLRTQVQGEPAAPRHRIEEWIADCFKRDYSRKARSS